LLQGNAAQEIEQVSWPVGKGCTGEQVNLSRSDHGFTGIIGDTKQLEAV